MSNSTAPFVVIGTGLAGYNLVKELRKLAPEQEIIMITADDGRNYSKPMLSTGFGKNKSADELAMGSAADMAAQLNIVIRTHTSVTKIDTANHKVFVGEEPISYSKLVLAWGAEAIRPRMEGDGADRVFSINDLEDYASFRAIVDGKKRVLVMGAGLIGCEFANDMVNGGFEVEVVAPCEHILPTLLPTEAAHAVQEGLEGLGVKFHLGPLVTRINRDGDGVVAQLSNGTNVAADAVVSAIGLRPRLDLAVKAGIQVNHGIVADRLLQTSEPDVYTLGDCAEVEGRVLLYVLPLMASARALAKTLTGTPTEVSYGVMPVTVKTPVVPVVVSPAAPDSAGRWIIEREGADVQAEFRNEAGDLLGYALTGAKVMNKVALNKELPAIMP
ncbi:FAD-dependent oxidoreductase [Thalassolituus oleivorans]|jgi:rubredoxin-NAD+ reductase|uniref:FAD-dependent pyridine nucleotide-disulfide oxidoreductase n=2 Tax=Thalassolituus oleivorans TaxID=187493 RepID=M5DMP7_9GAMM|nr:FAD-dependent oxidoreductase [Thalassolituus oleivorans]AHK14702.1 pyridine nucleotide-disulfide oxidoreductase [Thalassolituus oleivorans R6-15]MCA6127673.1 pyridine nucleotide-disulfide oxidoreductase [Thalassolituus oleivorans 4BN06-13]CCU70611.1 FAD-dependent pyridine nucleotide-disulfide oxidoreductase [Thalassolituus oleivorans MIL-1]